MKIAYGLIVIAGLLMVTYWAVSSDDVGHQVESGPISPPSGVYDPVLAGEATPSGFRQLLPRDAIVPVYNPSFTNAAASHWDEDTLVIGLTLDGEAKAYPVSFLNRREMVIDWIAGTPILVSW